MKTAEIRKRLENMENLETYMECEETVAELYDEGVPTSTLKRLIDETSDVHGWDSGTFYVLWDVLENPA